MRRMCRAMPAALLLLALLITCLAGTALAEDVCTVDISRSAACATDCSYLRVKCPLDGETPVMLTITDAWGYPVYQRDYGTCGGVFLSDDVYLRLGGDETVYHVTLQLGAQSRALTVTRTRPRLTDSGVYAAGLPLRDVNGGSRGEYAVLIDVDALEGRSFTTPLISGGMQVGEVTFAVYGGMLDVTTKAADGAEVERTTVYVARDAVTAMTLGSRRFTGEKLRSGLDIDLRGTPYAAVMVQLTLTYDEEAAWSWSPDAYFLNEQQEIWRLMQLMTANEAVG